MTLSLDKESTQIIIDSIKLFLPWLMLIVLFICAVFYPTRFEKFIALIWKVLSKIFKAFPFFQKKYIEHDLQSRVNSFVNNFLLREIKDFQPIKLKVNWIEDGDVPTSFKQDGKLIVRMKKEDNDSWNFVRASMVFIAENLLKKSKIYISKKQKESIDLFVGKKLFDNEKEEVVERFIDNFLHPKIDDKKIDSLFEQYLVIDKTGLFFPVFIQEMSFLGGKVFNNRKDEQIIKEVTSLISFLHNYSNRRLGEDVENKFLGNYCRFGIMIIGKSQKIIERGPGPYRGCLEEFKKSFVESLYVIADARKKEFVKDNVCNELFLKKINFRVYNEKDYKREICDDNHCRLVDNYLMVLRNNQIDHYYKEGQKVSN